MDLFDFVSENKNAPLAERMRPKTLADFVGQTHLLYENSLLMRAIKADKLGSCIFYGPPGTGKTTLAGIIANVTKGEFVKLNAVSSGVADAKKVIETAENQQKLFGKKTYLLLDECHRWSKSQSDCVLSAIEKGSIIFIGSTTENPFVSMTRAIVSRCRVFELKPLTPEDIVSGLRRAVQDKTDGYGNLDISVSDDALKYMAWASNGDLRNALNGLELAVLTTMPDTDGKIVIDKTGASQSMQSRVLSIDDSLYYDMLSAFCKSLRGCDPDSALYWAYRLLAAGCDPMLVFRRLMAHASEDVGLADSHAMTVVTSALFAYEHMGIQEGIIPLTHAIIYVATARKSNSVVTARDNVHRAVELSADDAVPDYLKDRNYPSPNDSGEAYIYPHATENYITQTYLPLSLKGSKFYEPGDNPKENDIAEFLEKIRKYKK